MIYYLIRDNQALLDAFVALFDFTNMEFDLALRFVSMHLHWPLFLTFRRYFLSTFRIPGESKLIERILQAYAIKYYEDNKHNTMFVDSDAAFVFSYSIIMLATDQYVLY